MNQQTGFTVRARSFNIAFEVRIFGREFTQTAFFFNENDAVLWENKQISC